MEPIMKGLANEEELVDLLSDLVRIESVNPLFGKGGSGETGMVEYICRYFDRYEIPYTLQEAMPGRFNVVAHLKGSGEGALCFEAHTDTVTVDEMEIDPFTPTVKDGKLYGRGSVDDKGSVATMMYAMRMLKEHGITPYSDIYFAAAAEEEFSYRGVLRLLEEGIPFDAAVVGEGTCVHICRACKGNVRFKIVTHGLAGHSSRPWEGRNAIVSMANVICALEKKLFPVYAARKHPLLGSPTLNISLINGGKLINIIPDRCEIQIDRRVLPGETFESVKQELEESLKELLAEHPEYDIEIEDPFVTDFAMEVAEDSPIVKTAAEVCDKLLGEHVIEGGYFSCDASKFTKVGIPAIVMGPGSILQAHTNDEFIAISDLVKAAEVFAQICVDFRPQR
ncbi:MAG: M20 family metallopeptidase [Lawsonibacter sp.]|jgi:acetylornithine deacetylase/succinyl-diaminopimelate desuccinylase family protein